MNIINITEKPSVAKTISNLLSNNKKIENTSNKYIKNIIFPYTFQGKKVNMVFTSVLGHLTNLEYVRETKWTEVDPFCLFEDEIQKNISDLSVSSNIKKLVRNADILIIWTDCDREGENIGREIKNVALEVKSINIKRARFSGISKSEIESALNNLTEINEDEANAVDTRMELDLRIGSSITRLQTLQLKFPKMIISYGSCQIPTLGFVVHRHQQIINFIPEKFYSLNVSITKKIKNVFRWRRDKIFDKNCVITFYEFLTEKNDNSENYGTIKKVIKSNKNRTRPLPLRTVELQKVLSKYLKIDSHKIMEISESLYNKGYISYPRTETDCFPRNFNFKKILNELKKDNDYINFAENLVKRINYPIPGKNNDQAHLPIYPIKDGNSLNSLERQIYDFVSRRFMACLSENAKGEEISIEFEFKKEIFQLKGLKIKEKNYLEIYPYDKWEEIYVDEFKEGEKFILNLENKKISNSFKLDMNDGVTTPPSYLTESELITLMDKNGIGTDATIHEHILKIQKRKYATKSKNKIYPTDLGTALILGYENAGLDISYPFLRSGFENDLKSISNRKKDPNLVLKNEIKLYKEIYRIIESNINKIRDFYEDLKNKRQSNNNSDIQIVRKRKKIEFLNHNENKTENKLLNQNENGNKMINQIEVQNNSENNPLCNCKIPSKKSIVTKKGKNHGKEFFSCNKWPNGCDFFQWTDCEREVKILEKEEYKCFCGYFSEMKISNTDANKGRKFLKCKKVYKPCKFFKWID